MSRGLGDVYKRQDTEAKESTIQALPTVMEYYKNLGYSFKAIDRESLVVHHSVNN